MHKTPRPQWCQQCGRFGGSIQTDGTPIMLDRIKGRLLCQNCRPKIKLVEVQHEETQLSFEVENSQKG